MAGMPREGEVPYDPTKELVSLLIDSTKFRTESIVFLLWDLGLRFENCLD